jgi:integrase
MGYIYKRGNIWWIGYGKNCARRESAETRDEETARALLKLREGDIVRGTPTPNARLRRVTVGEILASFVEHQRMIGSKSIEHVKRYYIENELLPVMGRVEVRALTTELIESYIVERQRHGYSNSTINKALACLNRALVLSLRNSRIQARPYVPLLKPAPPREGFYTEDEWRRLSKALQAPRRRHAWAVLETARLTGCRISELIGKHGLEWRNVNLQEGWIRLEGGTTKNGEGRTLPILPALHPVLASLWEQRLQQQSITPWVFSYAGRPIASIKSAFQNARIEAGLPERRIHDTRRTFRRYLALAGVSDKVGQQIMGHKDLKTYQAYFPVIEADKMAAATEIQKVLSR